MVSGNLCRHGYSSVTNKSRFSFLVLKFTFFWRKREKEKKKEKKSKQASYRIAVKQTKGDFSFKSDPSFYLCRESSKKKIKELVKNEFKVGGEEKDLI